MNTIVFTGGGTGGHVYPGLAVIEMLNEKWNGEVLWIGSNTGMEKAIVRARGIPFRGIPSGKLRRHFSVRNFLDLFRVAGGILASGFILLRLRPRLVFSKGGYVGFPPVFAARLLGIPVVAHESDLDPGLATLLSSPFATRILVPYGESPAHFPARFRRKITVTGNPVRREMLAGTAGEGRRILNFPDDRPILLVLGGSQGAREINHLVLAVLDRLLEFCRVVHQMGEGDYRALDKPGYHAAPYFTAELPHILAASSAVVSRAGAGSLWEFLALAKPALLIPLRGYGTRGDQIRNAELFERMGAARVLRDDPVNPEAFLAGVRAVLDPAEPARVREAVLRVTGGGNGGAAEKIADIIIETMKKEPAA